VFRTGWHEEGASTDASVNLGNLGQSPRQLDH
jgi:hypothetical protein